MIRPSMDENKKKVGIIRQIATLFALGMLVIGLFAFFSQQVRYDSKIRSETVTRSTDIAEDVTESVNQIPAHKWLISYWYRHADELDIEYDVTYAKGTKTEEKSKYLQNKYPNISLRYATEDEIRQMEPEDQKTYAEVTYSWLITQLNQIKSTYDVDFLFCVVPYDSFNRQFFLFSAADPGAVRGTEYGQTYPLGHRVHIIDESQRQAMIDAQKNKTHIASAGPYVDCYYMMGKMGEWPLLIGITYDVTSIRSQITSETLRSTLVALSYQLLLALICMFLLFRFVIRPLKQVMDNIRMYKKNKDSKAVVENLSKIQSQNEIGQLAEDIMDLTREMDDHTERIRSITAENERISTELTLANRIQNSMLPGIFPPFPDRNEFEIFASMDPAKEVGGDFYDFFLIDEDHLCMVIADVSGKGVPAALFMMASKIILSNNAKMGKSPSEILTDTNDSICANNEEKMFVTVWIGILEISTGKLRAANAGHEYPAGRLKDGSFEIIRDKHGFVIGGMAGLKYSEYEVDLEPGTCIFLYTDGVPEATNANDEQFGTDRMLEALNENEKASPDQLILNVKNAVEKFTEGEEQFDDLTMMCVRYNGRRSADE